MEPDLSALDEFLDAADADGYLIGASSDDATQLYVSGFDDVPDPFTTLYTPAGPHLLVSDLEYGRAREVDRAAAVRRYADYDFRDRVEEHGTPEAGYRVVGAFLEEFDAGRVATPRRFPLGLADALRDQGVEVEVNSEDVVADARAVKTDEEVDHVRRAQAANERAMEAAERVLRAATVDGDRLYHDGEVLTSERVKRAIETTLMEHDCGLDDTIVSCGAASADPHDRGSGPLDPHETIVVDIFPQDRTSKYHADMTRTFLVGEPTEELRQRYEVTCEAVDAALAAVEPGATGAEVHGNACDVYEREGYATLRSDEGTETGFIHSTGHGIGLEVHEQPSVSTDGDELEPGHVITIEPGLYDPEVGGIRIEDLVVVTGDGHENLTDYPREFVVG